MEVEGLEMASSNNQRPYEFEGEHIISSIKEGNTNSFNTIFNGLNAISGIGMLSVPYALASGGWLSLALLFIIALASSFSGILVKRCLESNPNIKSYSDIGERAYGRMGRTVVSILLYVELYMVTTGFLILEGDNLHSLFPHVSMMVSNSGKKGFVMIVSLLLLPTVWLDDLNILAYTSVAGVMAFLVVLASIICVGASNGVGFHKKGNVLNLKGIPTALSLYMFCYGAHPVFPTLYSSMKNKRHFSKVLVLCFFLSTLCYAAMAIFGYMMFGSSTNSQITLNLPTGRVSSQVAIYTTVLIPLAKYALMMKPIAMTTEGWFPSRYRTHKAFKLVIRTTLVASQVGVALGVPFFGYIMSLVGALLAANASLTIPCICYWKITGTKRGVEMFFIVSIVVLGLLIVFLGTYTSLVEIVDAIKASYKT